MLECFFMTWKREHTIISVIKVTEVLGFSLILPLLPFYAQTMGASPFQVGLILATFSLFQFISAPIMGKLSDSYGRRPLLMLSQLSTLVSFLVLGLANNLALIYLSRAIDGILGSNYTIAQAYLTDVTPQKDRTRIFSISGIAFSLGFFLGPAIGGYLSQFSYALPAYLAAVVTGITILTTYLYLPETIKHKKQFSWSWKIFKFEQFKLLTAKKQTAWPLWEFFFYALTHAIFTGSFALYAERQAGLTAQDTGYLFAIIGASSILIRLVLLPKLLDWLTERQLRITGGLIILLALLTSPLAKSQLLITINIVFFALGASTLRPSLISHISQIAKKDRYGKTMGIADSLGSISHVIGPLIGGLLIQNFLPGSLGLAAALTMSLSLSLMIFEKKLVRTKSVARPDPDQ